MTGDDTHFYTGECGMGVNVVQADALSAPEIIAAIKAGRAYCTQGPEILRAEYDPQRRVYALDCSPARHVVFYSDAAWSQKRCATGEGLTHVEYTALENEHYLRVEVIDDKGGRAWTSPVAI